jgi:hypothetical protein
MILMKCVDTTTRETKDLTLNRVYLIRKTNDNRYCEVLLDTGDWDDRVYMIRFEQI